MKSIFAFVFKQLFRIPYFRDKYYAIHKRIFLPFGFFKGVEKHFLYRKNYLLSLDLGDWIQQQVYFLGDYEKQEIDFLYRNLQKGDVFVDVGANIGLFTLNASKLVGNSGKVYAFEAFKPSFNKLKYHIDSNQINNTLVEHCAIVDQEKMIEILYHKDEQNFGMASSYLQEFSNKELVKGISLDDYVEDKTIQNIKLIKIDIEGGEYDALQGMKQILKNQKPKVLIEVNTIAQKNAGKSQTDLEKFFQEIKYQCVEILSENDHSHNAVFEFVGNDDKN